MSESSVELQSQIDRLVDGELAHEERRELMLMLDEQPGEWRRLALAFVESQVLKQEMLSMNEDPPVAHAVPSESLTAPRRTASSSFVAAIALSFIVGIGLGTAWWKSTRPEPLHTVDKGDSSATRNVRDKNEATRPVWPALTDNATATPRTVRLLTRNPDGGREEEIDIPIIEVDDSASNWLENQQSAFPTAVRRALERMGHTVSQRREFIPVELDDGRTVVVPVEDVQVRFLGDREIQ